ncbi:MAG: peptide chain release factor N(5)-glutamine methyltransferase [Chitinophagaceae bacterium]
MMNWSQAFYQTKEQLSPLYDPAEAAAVAHMLLEQISGMSKMERLMQKDGVLDASQEFRLETAVQQLRQATPIQYILGEAWFLERRFVVNPSVLIPRPETEELVLWIVQDFAGKAPAILDIGTGSGCIPISLKKEIPAATVEACDISSGALETAMENAAYLDADVTFKKVDILSPEAASLMGMYDVIVSNPPYIPEREAAGMHANVTGHEPHLALFVEDDDPLMFYRNIAQKAMTRLKDGGCLYFEIHRDFMPQTRDLLHSLGYTHITPRRDMHDNWRMIRAGLQAP